MTCPYEIQPGIVVIEKELKVPDHLDDHLDFALMTGLIKPKRIANIF